MKNKNINLGILLLICAAASFGFYPSMAKLAFKEGVNQSYLIICTTGVRAIALILFAGLVQKHAFKGILDFSRDSIVSGLLQALSVIGIIASLEYIPGPVMITIVFTHTIMLLIYSACKGRLVLSTSAVATTIAALVGVSMVVDLYSNFANVNVIGVCLAFIGALATASRFYAFGELAKTIPSVIVGARALSYATLFLLCLIYFQEPRGPTSQISFFYVFGCALSLAVGSILVFYTLSLMDIFRISFILKLEPIFTSIYAIAMLGEILKPVQYLGIFLVLLSLILYEYFERLKKLPR